MVRKVLTIAGYLAGSGAVFVGSVAGILAFKGQLNREGLSQFSNLPIIGEAFPKEPPKPEEKEKKEDEVSPSRLVVPFPRPLSEEFLLQLINDLQKAKKEFKEKEEAIGEKEKNLVHLQKKLEELRGDLGDFMAGIAAAKRELDIQVRSFEENVTLLKREEEKNIQSLAEIYGGMRPEAAARSLEALDQATTVKILAAMDPRLSGKIFSALSPEKTVELAERWKKLKKETSEKK